MKTLRCCGTVGVHLSVDLSEDGRSPSTLVRVPQKVSHLPDSNRQPRDYKSRALPIELKWHISTLPATRWIVKMLIHSAQTEREYFGVIPEDRDCVLKLRG